MSLTKEGVRCYTNGGNNVSDFHKQVAKFLARILYPESARSSGRLVQCVLGVS